METQETPQVFAVALTDAEVKLIQDLLLNLNFRNDVNTLQTALDLRKKLISAHKPNTLAQA